MSKEREGLGDGAQESDAGSQPPAGNVLNEAEKERNPIRGDPLRGRAEVSGGCASRGSTGSQGKYDVGSRRRHAEARTRDFG